VEERRREDEMSRRREGIGRVEEGKGRGGQWCVQYMPLLLFHVESRAKSKSFLFVVSRGKSGNRRHVVYPRKIICKDT
jgi:hypothetical protein